MSLDARWKLALGQMGLVFPLLLAGCGGGVHQLVSDTPVKVGRPYAVSGRTYYPSDDPTYDQIGEASWYGSYEQGRRTASGETFFKQRVSAASTTLPLPSYVEVTRLDTGQRMLVRINDRGPFARDRILDLSHEAARQLGIDRAGRAMVRVRRITPTEHQRAQLRRGYPVQLTSVTPTATPPRTGRVAPAQALTVQLPVAVAPASSPASKPLSPSAARSIIIASPNDADAADALATSLVDEKARVVATGSGYRVITGPYEDAVSLSAALARLRTRGYQGTTVIDANKSQEPNGTMIP